MYSQKTQLLVLQWNSNSVVHLPTLRVLLSNQNIRPQVICLQETWVKSPDRIPKIPNYSVACYFNRPGNNKGGGVIIYIKNGIPYEPLELNFTDPYLEVCATTLHLQNEKITLLNCYDPPPSPDLTSRSKDKYPKLLDIIPTRNYILLGDFNAHSTLWSSKRDARGTQLSDLVTDRDLLTLNTGQPTMADYDTTPDLTIMTPDIGAKCSWRIFNDPCTSDHLPILINIATKYKKMGTSVRPKWKLDKADWEHYKTLSESISINPLNNIDEVAEEFTKSIQNICQSTIPKTSNKPRKVCPPWWNDECTQALRERNQARKRYLKHKTQPLKDIYNSLKIKTKDTLRDVKTAAWQNYISQLEHKASSKKVWNTFNRFRGSIFENTTCLKINDTPTFSDKGKANALAQHYQKTAMTRNQDSIFQLIKNVKENEFNSDPACFSAQSADPDLLNSSLNSRFTMFELRQALQFKRNSAPGADTISYEMLKQLPDSSKASLLSLINLSWRRGKVPQAWKLAEIIPILKPRKDKLDPQSSP